MTDPALTGRIQAQDRTLLSGIMRRRRELADNERAFVRVARADGLTWEDIADAIGDGMTAEQALAQYGEPTRKPWTYKRVDVWPADRNSSGIRWYARVPRAPMLRADTKASMRDLINRYLAGE